MPLLKLEKKKPNYRTNKTSYNKLCSAASEMVIHPVKHTHTFIHVPTIVYSIFVGKKVWFHLFFSAYTRTHNMKSRRIGRVGK